MTPPKRPSAALRVGLIGMLAVGWLGITEPISLAAVKMTDPATENAPRQPALQDSDVGDSPNTDNSTIHESAKQDKEKKTMRARLLALFLKLFDGYRGPAGGPQKTSPETTEP